jgi:hypothetical protein
MTTAKPLELFEEFGASEAEILNDLENQAFLMWHDLAPPPPPAPTPLPSVSCLSFSVFLCVAAQVY